MWFRFSMPMVVTILLLGASPCGLAEEGGPTFVDFSAFGDTAHIAGNGVFAEPPPGYFDKWLKGVESLRSPDVNFLNLEATLTRTCHKFAAKQFAFTTSPSALSQLINWGFNLISLANNHSADCVDPRPAKEITPALQLAVAASKLRDDPTALALHGSAATARDLEKNVGLLEIRGVRIGFVSIKAWENGRYFPVGNLNNRTRIFKAVRDADVDVRILSIHGGKESVREPDSHMVQLARDFVTKYNGDIVLGHHSHTMQGFEIVKTADERAALILYSLGNHLHSGLGKKGDGMVARFKVSKLGFNVESLRLFPLRNASRKPALATPLMTQRYLRIIENSNRAISLQSGSASLVRLPTTLELLQAGGIGVSTRPTTSLNLK